MSGADPDEEGPQRRQLRLVGTATLLSGLVTVAAAQVLADPYQLLLGGLGFLAVATTVFEYTEGLESGLSIGFLTAGIIVWVSPVLTSEPQFTFVGLLLVLLGLLNVVFPPFALYFQRLGRRLGEGNGETESERETER